MINKRTKNIISAILILLILFMLAFLIKAYFDGHFNSKESLQDYIKGFGVFAPLVLTVIQAVQVVIPILPGFFGCAVGAVLFGTTGGFICNYVGISLGSVIAFFLSRKFGVSLIKIMFSEGKYEKWSAITDKWKSFPTFMFIATLLPLSPDDFLCYFSGLTKMSAKKFIWIIVLGKPWCILVYSILFAKI